MRDPDLRGQESLNRERNRPGSSEKGAAVNVVSCRLASAPCVVALLFFAGASRADDAVPAAPAASVSLARPAAIYLQGSCAPAYPGFPRPSHPKGVTRVRFTIDATGVVTNAEVIERSGLSHEHRLLDKAAIDALSKCPVRIGLDENGKPVGAQIVASYVWK